MRSAIIEFSCSLLLVCCAFGDYVLYSFTTDATTPTLSIPAPFLSTIQPTLSLPGQLKRPESRYDGAAHAYIAAVNATIADIPRTSYFDFRIVSTGFPLQLVELSFAKYYGTENFHQMGYALATSLDGFVTVVASDTYVETNEGVHAMLGELPAVHDITLRTWLYVNPSNEPTAPPTPPYFDVLIDNLLLQWESLCVPQLLANGSVAGYTASRELVEVQCARGFAPADDFDQYRCFDGVVLPAPLCVEAVECGLPHCVRTRPGCVCAACEAGFTLHPCNFTCAPCTACAQPFQYEHAPCSNVTDRVCGVNACVINYGGCDTANGLCVPALGAVNQCTCKAGYSGTGVGAGSCVSAAAHTHAAVMTWTMWLVPLLAMALGSNVGEENSDANSKRITSSHLLT